jgi:hypothetical protein
VDLGFVAVDDLDRSAGDLHRDAAASGASHVVLIEGETPLAVLPVDAVASHASSGIGDLIDLGDRLTRVSPTTDLGHGLTTQGLFVGDDFAVDMAAGEQPLVLFAPEEGTQDLLDALRLNSFTLAQADSQFLGAEWSLPGADTRLPGPRQPIPIERVRLRCPVGPHAVLVARGTTICPEHGAVLSP